MAKRLSAEEIARAKTDFDAPERRTTGKGNHSATGRPPSADPKRNFFTVKMTDGEKAELEDTAELLQMKKSRVLMEGLHRMTEKARAEAWRRQEEGRETT